MLNIICSNKTAYHKGQIFPFMLAVLAILIIMLLMTVNLGQLSMFKTDTANSADAGALAGSSTVSGALLGLGLTNDAMAGEAYISILAAIVFFVCFNWHLVVAVLVIHMSKSMLTFVQQWGESVKALGLARKTALQYAWQNVGVDEPKPSLKTFVQSMFGKSVDACPAADHTCVQATSTEMAGYQQIYEDGYDITHVSDPTLPVTINRGNGPLTYANASLYQQAIRTALSSGFGQFMSDDKNGWWRYGIPSMDNPPPGRIYSVYGWQNDAANTSNLYPNTYSGGVNSNPDDMQMIDEAKAQFDNVVTVEVTGPVIYDFYLVSPADPVGALTDCLVKIIAHYVGDWLEWIYGIFSWMIDWVMNFIMETLSTFIVGFPIGVGLVGEMDNSASTNTITANPIVVQVTRYKKNNTKSSMWDTIFKNTGIMPIDQTTGAYSVASRSEVTLSNVLPNKADGTHDCASVLPTCCYECSSGAPKLKDPLVDIGCQLIMDILDGNSIIDTFKDFMDSKRHLYESQVTNAV